MAGSAQADRESLAKLVLDSRVLGVNTHNASKWGRIYKSCQAKERAESYRTSTAQMLCSFLGYLVLRISSQAIP